MVVAPPKVARLAARWRVGAYLGLVSLVLLWYQVLVTRVLSTLLVYHYAFFVASFAICGIGLGALLLGRLHGLGRSYGEDRGEALGRLGALIALSLVVSWALLWNVGTDEPLVYALGTSLPYVLFGLVFALLFRDEELRPGRLYAWDLAGAVLGVLLAILGLECWGMLRSWTLLPALVLVAGWIVAPARSRLRWLTAVGVLSCLLPLALAGPKLDQLERTWPAYLASPEKFYGKLTAERGPGSLEIVRTRWDSFARTDVIELRGEPDRKAVTIDGVAYSGMFRFDGDPKNLERYPDDAGYLPSIGRVPFAESPFDEVLILGSGAGRDLLYAIAAKSHHIDAVEINRASVEFTREFGSYNGRIYERPDVNVVIADGRHYVEQTQKQYDLIVMTLMKTEATAQLGLALAEDYLLTREAFVSYLRRLKPEGKLALFLHHEAALAKATATALLALGDSGVAAEATPQHLAVFNSRKLDPNQEVYQPLLLVARAPIAYERALRLGIVAETHDNLTGYLPDLREAGRLSEVRSKAITPEEFPNGLPYNAAAATDDAPFFYRFDDAFTKLFVPAIVVALLLTLVLAAPLLANRERAPLALYFAVIGFGFMATETLLVQRLGRLLGHPTYAFGVTVVALLVGSSLGSLIAETSAFARRFGSRPWQALGIALYLGLVALEPDWLLVQGATALGVRSLLAFALVAPLGIALGTLFPRGISLARALAERDVARLIAINGLASVLGTFAAVCVAMYAGFCCTLLAIAALYLFVLLVPFSAIRPSS